MLFQEIHENSQSPEDEKWNGLPNSLSLPDRLHQPPSSAPLPTSRSAEWQPSPPPTSNSFASFQTFGKPGATSPKSYGGMSFSSGSTVRDSEVMRKKAKNHANNVSSPESSAPKLPEISVDKANDYYHSRKASTSGSEESATPTTAAMALPKVHSAASSSTHLADLPPQLPAPTGLLPPTPARAKRASLMAGLTPAQVKRISSALGEIQQRLQQTEPVHNVPGDDDVEVLDPTPVESAQRQRLPSDVSTRSTASSVFPFGVSPTGSSFTANLSTTGSTTATPPKLSHSPRSHNLQAHVQPERAPPPAQPVFARAPKPLVPQPILTPSRTIPARHTPSLSLSSGDLSPVPVYVPGQPRPVGSMHRSDGSVSSRSATPTHGEGLTLGHARADSTPAPRIAQRSTSLGRSRSVNQTYTPTKSSLHESIGSASSKRPLDSRRLSSSLGSHSPRDDVIQEDEEEEDHRANYHRNDHPELRQVLRRSVAESKQSSLDQSPVPGPGNLKLSPTIPSCVPSQEGTMDESSDTHGTVETRNTSISVAALRSPTLRRSRSLDSLSSGFMEFDELGWEDIFSNSDSDMPVTPGDDLQAYAQTLKRLTGMGQEEFAEMQDKLVEKARQERRALREAMDESPLIPYSPPQRKESPMLAYERGSPQPTVPSPLILGPVMDRVAIPKRAAPPPPEPDSQPMAKNPSTTSRSEESEVVFTPATPGLTRKVSRRVAPENDPEIRRDFEARIAAATAALNRTPSNPSGSFSGKFSRTKAAVNISSPRLMSSSSNVPTTPLSTPEMDVAKALDKASGSSGKMSLRWKKLKKGLSFSGDGTPQSLQDGAPILEEPIALHKREVQTKPATLTSPDINSFKFPNTAASDQTRYRARPALPLPDPPASAPLASKTITADSPPDKFVKAGRAAGLDDDQLEEMIRVNGLGRSNSASAGPSLQRVLSKPESKVEPVKGSMSKAKGLLRSLSKNRKVEPLSTDVDAVDDSITPTASTSARTFPIDSRQVVRRTLLIPTEGHNGINNVQDSPGQGSTGSPSAQRKASVRRKPLNLSQEDQQLVSETPSPHSRKFSMNSSHKSEPDDTPEPAENAGLGFLQPPSGMLRSTSQGTALTGASDVPSDRASSGGASFYDYYGEGEETLVSPNGPTTARPGLSRSSTQAVEITEYADGRMVWSLVDGLRHVDAADMIPGHSRNASYDSATPSDGDVFKADEPDGTFVPTAGLILRHKDRGQPAARPPTNVSPWFGAKLTFRSTTPLPLMSPISSTICPRTSRTPAVVGSISYHRAEPAASRKILLHSATPIANPPIAHPMQTRCLQSRVNLKTRHRRAKDHPRR